MPFLTNTLIIPYYQTLPWGICWGTSPWLSNGIYCAMIARISESMYLCIWIFIMGKFQKRGENITNGWTWTCHYINIFYMPLALLANIFRNFHNTFLHYHLVEYTTHCLTSSLRVLIHTLTINDHIQLDEFYKPFRSLFIMLSWSKLSLFYVPINSA